MTTLIMAERLTWATPLLAAAPKNGPDKRNKDIYKHVQLVTYGVWKGQRALPFFRLRDDAEETVMGTAK